MNPRSGLLELDAAAQRKDFGDGTGEYVAAASNWTDENFITARVDHRFSDTTSFSAGTRSTTRGSESRTIQLFALIAGSRNQYVTTQLTRIFSRGC